jgi:hypothetical protein
MTGAEPLQRRDFDQLVAEHQQLIRLANELEFQLYQMGDAPGPEQVAECRQTAGDLISLLRHVLFRHDQQVLPLLEDQTK